jgi:hypothetical protein
MYTLSSFRERAERVIDAAILATGTTARPTRALASSETLMRYLAVCRLRVTDVSGGDAAALFRLGNPIGFYLLDGDGIVYFGMFDLEPPKELVFRLKLLLQNLDQARKDVEKRGKMLPAEQVARYDEMWHQLRVEILVGKEIDRVAVERRVKELTVGLDTIPWRLITGDEMEARIKAEYDAIGEL